MRVVELRDLLATLPDDMVVLIEGVHIVYIRKEGARMWPVAVAVKRCSASGCPGERTYADRLVPASLYLGKRSGHPRTDPDPAVDFYGRWSRASRAVIDRYSEEPDAESVLRERETK